MSRALKDEAFVATHLKDRAPGADPREVLYEDPELGFCICGHVYGGQRQRRPARPRPQLGHLRPGRRRHRDDGLAHRQAGRRAPSPRWSSRPGPT